MIAKNIKGKSFGGCVRYVMDKGSELLEAEGVFADSTESVIRSFQLQRSLRSEIKQPVGHIPIAFSPEDNHRMTNEFMLQLAKEYMQEMGIGNTQYIIVRHHNTDHDHLHIVYNRIDNELKLISVNNDYKRNIAVCKKLKDRHGLTYGTGKEKVNREKLNGKDEVKYEIYDSIRKYIPQCTSYEMLINCLAKDMIFMDFKLRRGTDIIEGVSFQKDGYSFKGSEIDRKFSHKGLVKLFMTVERLRQQSQQMKQEQQNQTEQQSQNHQPQQQVQPQAKTPPTPTVKGIKLTEQQWSTLKAGGHIYLKDMLSTKGKRFDGYVFMDDRQKMFLFAKNAPDTFVKFGKYEMRERDKRLIEAGLVTRATVKWRGNTGQLAYPYLWKPSPNATDYSESWSDPRGQNIRPTTASQTAAPQAQGNTQSPPCQSIVDVATDTLKTVGNVAAGIASALGGAIDTITPDSDYNPDEAEAEYRRLMQRKKKRGIRM